MLVPLKPVRAFRPSPEALVVAPKMTFVSFHHVFYSFTFHRKLLTLCPVVGLFLIIISTHDDG